MERTLLATKLFIPQQKPGMVSRSRLLERLQTCLDVPLTLVSAPAGYGKTTLLSEWAGNIQTSFPVGWVSLEEDENNPQKFWMYFISSICRILPEIDQSILSSLASTDIPIETLLTSLVNDIAAAEKDFVLVLDDYQFIRSEPVHQGITFFLEHIPPGAHVIMATRIDPPLPLSRFRGKGLILEIGTDDLRFNSEEITSLSKNFDTPVLDTVSIETLKNKTEGWVAGLKMALISMRGKDNVDSFIADFSQAQRYIMDYLIEEVLHHQLKEIQEFLLKTSVLENMCGTLCDAVLGSSNSNEMLTQLEKDNLFIVLLDAKGEWYRYEHLFAELLRHRLDVIYGKETTAGLQRKASLWYESNGFRVNAIKHALAVEDCERALSLILSPVTPIYTYGLFNMAEWWKMLPQEVVVRNTRAGVIFARMLTYTGQFSEAVSLLDSVELSDNYDTGYEGYIAGARTTIAGILGDPKIEEYAKKALSLIPADDVARVTISFVISSNYISQLRLNEAEVILKDAYEVARKTRTIGGDIGLVLSMLADIAALRGKIRDAEKMLRQAAEQSNSFNSVFSLTCLTLIYYLWNDLETAEDELEKAFSLPQGTFIEATGLLYTYLFQIKLFRGDIQAAIEALEKIERLRPEVAFTEKIHLDIAALHVELAYAREDYDALDHWLEKFAECDFNTQQYMFHPIAVNLFNQRWPEEGKRRLDILEGNYLREGMDSALLHIYVARALLATDDESTVSFLAQALEIGKPEGAVRWFVDTGISLAPLLRRAISKRIEPEFCRKILSVIENEERQRKIRKGETPPPPESILSERELEVLRLTSEGFTNQQITEKLFITISTTKAHVRHIYDKLGVNNRTQALSRAKDLNIL